MTPINYKQVKINICHQRLTTLDQDVHPAGHHALFASANFTTHSNAIAKWPTTIPALNKPFLVKFPLNSVPKRPQCHQTREIIQQ